MSRCAEEPASRLRWSAWTISSRGSSARPSSCARASSRPTRPRRWSRIARRWPARRGRARALHPRRAPGAGPRPGLAALGCPRPAHPSHRSGRSAPYPDHLRAGGGALPARGCASPPRALTAGLEEAMRYSLLAGGKRIRPVLALATAEAVGIDRQRGPAAGRCDRAHPHLLADPRRSARDGRRRAAPRDAHLSRRVRGGRGDPGGRRALRGGVPPSARISRGPPRRAAGRGRRARRRHRGRWHGRRPVRGREPEATPGARGSAAPARAQDGTADRCVGHVRATVGRSRANLRQLPSASLRRSWVCCSR